MSEFNFKSQICTSREQSERLLALGLKKETADMKYPCTREYYGGVLTEGTSSPPIIIDTEDDDITEYDIPAWSLHRLIEMMPQYLYITRDKEEFYLDINNDGVMYDGVAMKLALVEFVECGNLYDNIIGCIVYLIKEGYFNKEYLV